MKYTIDTEVLRKNNINIGGFLCMLCLRHKVNIEKTMKALQTLFLVSSEADLFGNLSLTDNGNELLNTVIIESDKEIIEKKQDISILAEKLKDVFPKGKKDGTNNYWADGAALIERRLKLFFRKYGTKYTNEEILDAAKRYVASFNGNYNYMRTLRYFIFKEGINANGEVEGSSELLTYIENKDNDSITSNNKDWTSSLK